MKPLWITIIWFVSVASSYAGQIATGPIQQSATTSQQTSAWERDRWQPDKRFNAIDPKTGLRTGGFVEKDKWEPESRWNVYDQRGSYKGMVKRDPYESDRWNYTPSDSGIGQYDSGIPKYDDGIGASAP